MNWTEEDPAAKPGKKVDLKVPDVKEAHKIFDEVFIVVKSGDGGQGEIVQAGTGRWVTNLKYKPGGSQSKKIWLPASEPSEGSDGADVVLQCDPTYDNLLHLHTRKQYTAPRGPNGNPAAGSGGPKNNKDIRKARTAPFVIPVPPGTVVKRRSNGVVLGELINPGDKLVVARGGRGGMGVTAPSRQQKVAARTRQEMRAQAQGTEVVAVEDGNWKLDTQGAPGQQLSLHLLLRVVADVGIVGFPNAGKSSLLKALTRAAPEVAPYPFTTLMPNLGVLASGGPKKTVLADLPGLIEGAHEGKGLGRMFLRHLRRTRALLHVVDASAPDPATDYYAVREELRMYNPEYCARPHVVVLNKMDLQEADGQRERVIAELMQQAQRHCTEWASEEQKPTAPVAIVTASAATGEGIGELNKALASALNPRVLKDLQQRGTAATQVTISLKPAADTISRGDQSADSWHAAGERSSVTRSDAQQAGSSQGAFGLDDDDEEGVEKGELTPDVVWLFDLADAQLLKLADQDEAKCRMRENAAMAAGSDPYSDDTDHSSNPAASAGVQVTQAGVVAASGAAAAAAMLQGAGTAGTSDAAEAGGPQSAASGELSAASGGEEEGEDDEWVELTPEELELLKWMDEHEAAEAAKAAAAADAAESALQDQEAAVAVVEDDTTGPLEEADKWLFQLSEEELLALADKDN